jgi:hypothetical protein
MFGGILGPNTYAGAGVVSSLLSAGGNPPANPYGPAALALFYGAYSFGIAVIGRISMSR